MIFAKTIARNYEKRIMLWTSDARLTSHLSQQTNKPAYHIVDCRILKAKKHNNYYGIFDISQYGTSSKVFMWNKVIFLKITLTLHSEVHRVWNIAYLAQFQFVLTKISQEKILIILRLSILGGKLLRKNLTLWNQKKKF